MNKPLKPLSSESNQQSSKLKTSIYAPFLVEDFKPAPGNRNRRHQAEKFKFAPQHHGPPIEFKMDLNADPDDLSDQITLIRIIIKRILQYDPDNFELLSLCIKGLINLVQAQDKILKFKNKGKNTLGEDIKKIIDSMVVPLGVIPLENKDPVKEQEVLFDI